MFHNDRLRAHFRSHAGRAERKFTSRIQRNPRRRLLGFVCRGEAGVRASFCERAVLASYEASSLVKVTGVTSKIRSFDGCHSERSAVRSGRIPEDILSVTNPSSPFQSVRIPMQGRTYSVRIHPIDHPKNTKTLCEIATS